MSELGISKVEVFETDDGQRHNTLVEAEEHQSRRFVVHFLYECGIGSEEANEVVERLRTGAASRAVFSGWFQNLLRLDAEQAKKRSAAS